METTSDNHVKQNQKKKSSKKESHPEHENTDDSSNSSAMMKSIASVLQEIVNESEAEASANKSGPTSKEEKSSASFWAKKPPSISILGYFERIVKYSHIEDSTIIISLIFIDRLCEISNIQLNKHNIHRLMLAGVLLAIKYNEDDYYSNTFYAKVGGISLKEINVLELDFIVLIQHNLFVKRDIYNKYREYLSSH